METVSTTSHTLVFHEDDRTAVHALLDVLNAKGLIHSHSLYGSKGQFFVGKNVVTYSFSHATARATDPAKIINPVLAVLRSFFPESNDVQ